MKVFAVILGLLVAVIRCSNALRLSKGTGRSGSRLHEQAGHESVHEVREIKGLQEGLRFRKIPHTDIVVSELCLGTMMFGDQVSKAQATEQLDLAVKTYGLNFIDTAESYPAPSAASTAGQSEKIIGEWLRKSKSSVKREDVVISSMVCGFSDQMTWVRRDGQGTRVSKEQVVEAVDAQLKRLGTDYIDVLQIHWPERYVPLFGAPTYMYEHEREDAISVRDQIQVMAELIKAGKIRAYGLSNETPFGLSSFYHTAATLGLPGPVVTQNAYNLLERNDFETGMQEVCSPRNANVGLLAYSPLAAGALTGKYANIRDTDAHARMKHFVGFMHRYISPLAREAVEHYQGVADTLGLPLAQLALAFVYSRPFATSTILGATSASQLEDDILALNIPITDEAFRLINGVYRKYVDPTKGVFEVVDPNIEYVDASKLPWGSKDEDVDPEMDALINQRAQKF